MNIDDYLDQNLEIAMKFNLISMYILANLYIKKTICISTPIT